MRSNLTTTIVVTLVLSLEEAEWLHNVMQNPLMPAEDHGHEPVIDAEMRHKFFEATKAARTN